MRGLRRLRGASIVLRHWRRGVWVLLRLWWRPIVRIVVLIGLRLGVARKPITVPVVLLAMPRLVPFPLGVPRRGLSQVPPLRLLRRRAVRRGCGNECAGRGRRGTPCAALRAEVRIRIPRKVQPACLCSCSACRRC